jgi:hypothetical protein
MLKKILTVAMVAVLAVLLMPSEVDAWGAARVSYSRTGPYGGTRTTSRTYAGGPGGMYAGGRAASYGPYGGYRAGYGYGRAYGYNYGYGGAAVGGYRYGYIR